MKLKDLPDRRGYFGDYGGRFVPETLVAPLEELEAALRRLHPDPGDPVQDQSQHEEVLVLGPDQVVHGDGHEARDFPGAD